MKNFILVTLILALLLSTFTITAAQYTSTTEIVEGGELSAHKMIYINNCLDFFASALGEVPTELAALDKSNWTLPDKHWNYSLFYYIFKQKPGSYGYTIDSTGLNFGCGATYQLSLYNENLKSIDINNRCYASGTPTWQFYIYKGSAPENQFSATLMITHYDINNFIAGNIIPHVYKIEYLRINTSTHPTNPYCFDETSFSTAKITCGTVEVKETSSNSGYYDSTTQTLINGASYITKTFDRTTWIQIDCPYHEAQNI